MKTMLFWLRKRSRKPKMVGLATAAGSVLAISDYAAMAVRGDGRFFIVDAPTAAHGRRIIAAHRSEQAQDIGRAGLVFSSHDGRIVALGVNAIAAMSGAVEGVAMWDARIAGQGRVTVAQSRALTADTAPSLAVFDIGRDRFDS
jgi:hypothetical protein|tara:strand:- start:577 stop:1008 length:432 start_codon:yes stop_codon:yes gene_type:complete